MMPWYWKLFYWAVLIVGLLVFGYFGDRQLQRTDYARGTIRGGVEMPTPFEADGLDPYYDYN